MSSAFTVCEDRKLGEGILGTLYEGLECSTRHPVTITVLRPEFSGDPGFRRRFHREFARAGRVVHPSVVRTHGTGIWKGKLFLATETVNGQELRGSRRGEERPAPDEILRIAEGSARALLAAEDLKLTPLHLRRSNLLVTRSGAVKVAELGLARVLDTEAEYQRVVPRSPYLSPERTQGQKADVRSDIFALGVILYELATGRLPFEGHESKTSYVYQLLNVVPVFPPETSSRIPPELERVVLRCLNKDPEGRFQNAADLLKELLAVRRQLDRSPGVGKPVGDDSGDFEIHEDQILGEGGMGTVYKGRQKSLNRAVAIKVVRSALTRNGDLRKRFRREAELLARVRDGNVVQIFGAGAWKGRLYFAMELVEGLDLRSRVLQGPPLTLQEILHVGQGVAQALRAAWSLRIVHRDIKLSNILLARDGTIKVTDFGLATCMNLRRSKSQAILGTPGYLSPEQRRGTDVDIRSDLYSLGIVLFELVTGRLPFSKGAPQRGDRNPWRGERVLPSSVDVFLRRCLALSPDHRFQTPDEMLVEIQALREELRDPSPTSSATTRTWKGHPFPSPDGVYPRSIRDVFRLAMALGDHEVSVLLAESEYGPLSAEYRDASSRAREAAFREAERNAHQRFLAEDWTGAEAAYTKLSDAVESGRKEELRLAADYCGRLAAAAAKSRRPDGSRRG